MADETKEGNTAASDVPLADNLAVAERYAETEFERGALFALRTLHQRWPALVAVSAVDVGLRTRKARKLHALAGEVMALDGQRILREAGVKAAERDDLDLFGGRTMEPNWDELARGHKPSDGRK